MKFNIRLLKYKVLKSFFDIFIAFFAIIVLLPFLAFIFTLLWINLKTNPIFVQIRPGYKGKLFRIYKFKTMRDANPDDVVGLTDFERITKIGGFLRKLSLDELPQLFNVVFGQMSFVGPRPLLPEYLSLYSIDQMRRHNVLPGITGWSQINGRNSISWKEKFDLDIWYVQNQSLKIDFNILIKTFLVVITKKGINNSNQTIMPMFNGKN